MYPMDLIYSKEHEWVRLDGSRATIGITDFAQKELGDIVFVELPKLNSEVKLMANFATVESAKAVSDVYCPLSGSVVAVNSELEERPELINEEPYGKGWIAVIELRDMNEIKSLMPAQNYIDMVNQGE